MARKNDEGKRSKALRRLIRERQERTGEAYSTASMHVLNAASVPENPDLHKFFRRMAAEELIASRPPWTPGPALNLDSWQALEEVPLQNGRQKPTLSHHVIQVEILRSPLREALARKIVHARDVDGADRDSLGVIPLGIVTIENVAGERTIHRLPPPLGQWAAGQVALTRRGLGQFPSYLGFCRPRPGQYGVEFMPMPGPDRERYERALAEWRDLPGLSIPAASSETQGKRYEVRKAGGFFVPSEVCTEVPGTEHIDGARVILPTAVIWTLAGEILYRLPPPLGGWVILNMGAAAAGTKLLPAFVEFSCVDGRYLATFVDALTGDM